MKKNPTPKRLWKLTPGCKVNKSMRLSKGNIKWWKTSLAQMDWTDNEMMNFLRTAAGEPRVLFPKQFKPRADGRKK